MLVLYIGIDVRVTIYLMKARLHVRRHLPKSGTPNMHIEHKYGVIITLICLFRKKSVIQAHNNSGDSISSF